MRLLIPAIILFLCFPAQSEELSRLEIISSKSQNKFIFSVEVVQSEEELATGLMFREKLADDAGMLFLFEGQNIISMWMKNTLLPLDMLFIGGDGTIMKIARETTPLSLKVISSDIPAKAVLEINGGMSDLLGIAEGDVVYHDKLLNTGS